MKEINIFTAVSEKTIPDNKLSTYFPYLKSNTHV